MSDRATARQILQMENALAEDRAELEETLAQLRYTMQPKVQVQLLKEKAQEKVDGLQEDAAATWQGALAGDKESIMILLSTVVAAGATVAFIVWRIRENTGTRRQRKQWRRFTRELGKVYPPQGVDFTVR